MYIQLFYLFFMLHYIEPKVVDLSCNDTQVFVDGHNSRRLLLAKGKVPGQPAASEMRYVIWDEELATKAKNWAAQNLFAHNPDKTISSGRFRTGENIYKVSPSKNRALKMDDPLEDWFNEYKNYKFGPLKESDFYRPKHIVGHYTQMAWSDSIYIGCGVSKETNNRVEYTLVVCNYGPSGNIIGQKPYKDGDASNKLVCSGDCSRLYGDKC